MPGEDARKTYSAVFQFAGKLDRSLLAATKDVKNLFKSLDQAAGITDKNVLKVVKQLNNVSSTVGRTRTAAREFGNAWQAAGERVRKQLEPLHRLLHGIGHFTGIGAAIGAAGASFEAVEIAKEAWSTHAEREQSRLLLDTVLKNRGLGNQVQAFNDMLLKFSSDEAKIDYTTALESAQMMMNTGRFKGVADVHKILSQFADIGGSPEQSKLGLMAISKMLSEGRIEGRHLQELGFDLPQVGWYQEIAKIRGEDVGQLRKEMAKRGASIDAGVLLEVLQKITGPGGAMFGHAAAQMLGPAGEQARMAARWKVVLDKVGDIEDKTVTPVLTKLLGDIDVVKLQHTLDSAVTSAELLGRDLGTAYDTLRNTGALTQTKDLLADIGRQFGAAFGIKGGDTVQTITQLYGKLNDSLQWIDQNFQSIVSWTKAIAEGWIAINAIKLSASLISGIRTIGGAFVDLRNAVLGTSEAMRGLATAEGTAGAAGTGLLGTLGGILGLVAGSAWLSHYVEEESRKHAADIIEEGKKREQKGGKVEGQYNSNNFPDTPAMRELIDQHKKGADAQKAVNNMLLVANQALAGVAYAARGAANALSFLSPGGATLGNFPISGLGGGSMLPQTEYGPGVDWPGHGTPDSDSARGIGHIHGKAYSLNGYPSGYAAAMKAAYAEGHYHIKPGAEYISEKDHKKHRWLDTSGARNPKNEDFFKGAQIHLHNTFNITGPDPQETARVVQRRIQDSLPEMLRRANDEMSMGAFA